MANTSAIWQQAAHTTYQLSSLSCSTRAIQKSLTLNEKYLSFLEKKSGEWTISWKMTRQKEQEDSAEKTNQMTALRFQTGGRHQTSPASLRGESRGRGVSQQQVNNRSVFIKQKRKRKEIQFCPVNFSKPYCNGNHMAIMHSERWIFHSLPVRFQVTRAVVQGKKRGVTPTNRNKKKRRRLKTSHVDEHPCGTRP